MNLYVRNCLSSVWELSPPRRRGSNSNRTTMLIQKWIPAYTGKIKSLNLIVVGEGSSKSRVSLRCTQVTLFLILFCFFPLVLQAAPLSLPAVTVQPGANGEQAYSVNLQILIFMTLLTVLPGMLMAMTAFTRIIIVLSILRQAIGMAQTPTNQILIGIALFMTYFVMSPVFNKINDTAVQPYLAETMKFPQALSNAQVPLREFMLNQTRKNDLSLFEKFAQKNPSSAPSIFNFGIN